MEANLAPAQQTAVPGTESAVPKAPAGADALVQTQLLQQDPELQAPPALAMGAPVATAAEPSEVGPKPLLPEPEAAEEPSASKASLKPDAPTASAGQTSGRENSGGGDLKGKAETAAPVATAPEAEGAADQPFEPLVATTSARTETTTDLRQPGVARATPETVAGLAAQMARRIEGRNTRFEIALDPAGLGSVQVSVEINPRGELSAHLSFERGDSAAELRSRAAELQRALEQAGFDLSKGGLSFEHGPSGRGQERSAEHRHHGHARAFAQALDTADAADLLPAGPVRLNRARSGVDLTV